MDYQPPADEQGRFCYAFIDESSQTKYQYLVIGGLVVPFKHARQFEAHISGIRSKTIIPTHTAEGTPRVMKWQKVCPYNYEAYQAVIDSTFDFYRKLPIAVEMGMHCVAVNTSLKPLVNFGEGDFEVGFDKHFHFLCTVVFPKRYRKECFALYPDRRYSRRPLDEARDIMNRAVYKYGDRRPGLLRVLKYEDPERCQSLQIADILIGALAYKLNKHYNKPEANKAKVALCDHIWKGWKLGDAFATSPFQVKRFMTWLHRPEPPGTPRSGPQNIR